MGMNMVTIATAKITDYIVQQNPGTTCPALSSNVCADKKTSSLNRRLGRGRRVTVSSYLPTDLIDRFSNHTADSLHLWGRVIGRLAGLAGHNMQVANNTLQF
jgi:hydroxymethylglutaryl-CoA reductase